MKPRVTLAQIADRVGVTTATVSKALRHRSRGHFVGEPTRQAIWQAARELGYPIDRLRRTPTAIRRVAVFGGMDWLYVSMVPSLCGLLARRGITVVPAFDAGPQWVDLAEDWYRTREIDGAIRIGGPPAAPVRPETAPCVVIGDEAPGAGLWQVRVDDEAGARLVGEHLWGLGHRHVIAVATKEKPASAARIAGLRSVWEQRGLPLPDEAVLWLEPLQDSEADLAGRLSALLAEARGRGRPVTAIFAWHDMTAYMVLSHLFKQGLRVPADISVAGFDDLGLSSLLVPGLTTVRHPLAEMAALAIELLTEAVQWPGAPARVHRLTGELVVRGSTGPVPAKGD